MTTARRLRSYSYGQYLQALADSHIKLEFFEGEIYAMAGGTPSHAELAARVLFLLQRSLGRSCAVFSSDLKIFVESADLATFPDASVVCGSKQAAQRDPNAIVNPTVLVEVTSPSTESYDRNEKLRCYQQLSSLRAIILISHRARRVTVVSRSVAGWSEVDFRGGETLELSNPLLSFMVNEVYEGIDLVQG